MAAIDGVADQAVVLRDLLAVLGHEAEQGAEVVQVEQQEALLVGQPEHDLQHARPGCR